jgi:hypothetical protein
MSLSDRRVSAWHRTVQRPTPLQQPIRVLTTSPFQKFFPTNFDLKNFSSEGTSERPLACCGHFILMSSIEKEIS